jgi:hypothetical protein
MVCFVRVFEFPSSPTFPQRCKKVDQKQTSKKLTKLKKDNSCRPSENQAEPLLRYKATNIPISLQGHKYPHLFTTPQIPPSLEKKELKMK